MNCVADAAPLPPKLGDDIEIWDAAFSSEDLGYAKLYDNLYEVAPLHLERVATIGMDFNGDSLTQARAAATLLFPDDAVLQRTYSPKGRSQTTVDLYSSKTLAELMPDAPHGGNPGDFMAIYTTMSGGYAITLGVGDNP